MTAPIDRKKLRADEKKFPPKQWFAVRLKEPSAVGVGPDTGPTMEKVEYLSRQEHEALLKEANEKLEKVKGQLKIVLQRDWDWDMISSDYGMRRIQNYRGVVQDLIREIEENK